MSEVGIGGWCGFIIVLGIRKCGLGKGLGMEINFRVYVRCVGLDLD